MPLLREGEDDRLDELPTLLLLLGALPTLLLLLGALLRDVDTEELPDDLLGVLPTLLLLLLDGVVTRGVLVDVPVERLGEVPTELPPRLIVLPLCPFTADLFGVAVDELLLVLTPL